MRRLFFAQGTPLLAAVLLLSSCDRTAEGELGGTVIIGAAAEADALMPMLAGSVQGRAIAEQLYDRLADMGPDLNVNGDGGFEPRLARSWSWSPDSLVLTFSLVPDAKWHDGTPVRAKDVLSGYRVTLDPANGSSLASHYVDMDSVSVIDSLTVAVFYRRRGAEQFYAATMIFPLPSHIVDTVSSGTLRRSNVSLAPVGSGKFRFVSMEPRLRVELAAVPDHYRGRAKLDRLVFTTSPDFTSGLARVWAGETDVWEPLGPNDFAEAATHEHLKLITGPGYDYGFLGFNYRNPRDTTKDHPLFADREMRVALTLAVDRESLVRAIFDSLGLVSFGPFSRQQNTADTTLAQIPFDRAAAAAKLDSLGWRTVGEDGIRMRGRERLSFSLLAPTSSAVRARAAVLLQEQFKQVGVEARVEMLEFAAMRAEWAAGNFDATLGGFRTTPSPSGIRGTWASPAYSRSRQNVGDYVNPAFDAAVQSALGAVDPAVRRAEMRRAYEIIIADAPAIWIYEVRNAAAVHRRLNVPNWRSEAWWLTLSEWSVDPAQRLPRDARPATP